MALIDPTQRLDKQIEEIVSGNNDYDKTASHRTIFHEILQTRLPASEKTINRLKPRSPDHNRRRHHYHVTRTLTHILLPPLESRQTPEIEGKPETHHGRLSSQLSDVGATGAGPLSDRYHK